MRFAVEINLGNAEMSNGADVAQVLRKVANRLDPVTNEEVEALRSDGGAVSQAVFDVNGNTVGRWSLGEEEA